MAIILDGTSGITASNIAVGAGGINVGSGQFVVNSNGVISASGQPYFEGSLAGGVGANFVQPLAAGQYVSRGFTVDQPNGRITAQVAGQYLIFWHQLISCSGPVYFYIRKNGSAVYSAFTPTANFYDMSDCCILTLAVGDYIDFQYTGGSVTSAWSSNHSSVLMFKVA